MAEIITNLKKLLLALSIKYLLFLIIIIIGCSYQIIQVTQIYFKFEMKVDVKFELMKLQFRRSVFVKKLTFISKITLLSELF